MSTREHADTTVGRASLLAEREVVMSHEGVWRSSAFMTSQGASVTSLAAEPLSPSKVTRRSHGSRSSPVWAFHRSIAALRKLRASGHSWKACSRDSSRACEAQHGLMHFPGSLSCA